MKKSIINLFIILIFLSFVSCFQNQEKKFTSRIFYKDGTKIKGRFLNDSIKDGVFTYYYPTGEVGMIEVYENDSLKGCMVEFFKDKKIRSYALLAHDKETTYQIFWYPNGDTSAIIMNHISKSYYSNRGPEHFRSGSNFFTFDNIGKLIDFQGPIVFLTSKDSLDLDRSYPDWKKQIKDWEINNKNTQPQ